MVIPEDEYKRENTHDTIVPADFIPVNESYHQNPFNTGSQWSQFTRNIQLDYEPLNT